MAPRTVVSTACTLEDQSSEALSDRIDRVCTEFAHILMLQMTEALTDDSSCTALQRPETECIVGNSCTDCRGKVPFPAEGDLTISVGHLHCGFRSVDERLVRSAGPNGNRRS